MRRHRQGICRRVFLGWGEVTRDGRLTRCARPCISAAIRLRGQYGEKFWVFAFWRRWAAQAHRRVFSKAVYVFEWQWGQAGQRTRRRLRERVDKRYSVACRRRAIFALRGFARTRTERRWSLQRWEEKARLRALRSAFPAFRLTVLLKRFSVGRIRRMVYGWAREASSGRRCRDVGAYLAGRSGAGYLRHAMVQWQEWLEGRRMRTAFLLQVVMTNRTNFLPVLAGLAGFRGVFLISWAIRAWLSYVQGRRRALRLIAYLRDGVPVLALRRATLSALLHVRKSGVQVPRSDPRLLQQWAERLGNYEAYACNWYEDGNLVRIFFQLQLILGAKRVEPGAALRQWKPTEDEVFAMRDMQNAAGEEAVFRMRQFERWAAAALGALDANILATRLGMGRERTPLPDRPPIEMPNPAQVCSARTARTPRAPPLVALETPRGPVPELSSLMARSRRQSLHAQASRRGLKLTAICDSFATPRREESSAGMESPDEAAEASELAARVDYDASTRSELAKMLMRAAEKPAPPALDLSASMAKLHTCDDGSVVDAATARSMLSNSSIWGYASQAPCATPSVLSESLSPRTIAPGGPVEAPARAVDVDGELLRLEARILGNVDYGSLENRAKVEYLGRAGKEVLGLVFGDVAPTDFEDPLPLTCRIPETLPHKVLRVDRSQTARCRRSAFVRRPKSSRNSGRRGAQPLGARSELREFDGVLFTHGVSNAFVRTFGNLEMLQENRGVFLTLGFDAHELGEMLSARSGGDSPISLGEVLDGLARRFIDETLDSINVARQPSVVPVISSTQSTAAHASMPAERSASKVASVKTGLKAHGSVRSAGGGGDGGSAAKERAPRVDVHKSSFPRDLALALLEVMAFVNRDLDQALSRASRSVVSTAPAVDVRKDVSSPADSPLLAAKASARRRARARAASEPRLRAGATRSKVQAAEVSPIVLKTRQLQAPAGRARSQRTDRMEPRPAVKAEQAFRPRLEERSGYVRRAVVMGDAEPSGMRVTTIAARRAASVRRQRSVIIAPPL